MRRGPLIIAAAFVAVLTATCTAGTTDVRSTGTTTTTARARTDAPGTTATPDPPGLAPRLAGVPRRVYVPNGKSNTVSVIDPATNRVVSTFPTSKEPQHIVPSWDLSTLWVLDNAGNDLIPIDPMTARPGRPVPVDDPYNLYFTPDGSEAIVVAEAQRRLDFRDPHTMALQRSVSVPGCDGINHIDYPADDSYLVATCEFGGKLAKIDYRAGTVLGMVDLPHDPLDQMTAMPQDVRCGPDGHTFFVADMTRGGLYRIDGPSFTVGPFLATGVGTHGITPSRDHRLFYVANRGSRAGTGSRHGQGSVAVVDPTAMTVTAIWPIPHGGSPDMGNLSTDGSQLWLSGRFDGEVYVFDVAAGRLATRIKVGKGPHGLTYWPQPGTYSLGHTGNMR